LLNSAELVEADLCTDKVVRVVPAGLDKVVVCRGTLAALDKEVEHIALLVDMEAWEDSFRLVEYN